MFLDGVPLNGLVFCYGSLLLTVGGFIVFAVLTDLDARRTYLRTSLNVPEPPKPYAAMTPARDEVLFVDGDAPMTAKVQPAPVVAKKPAAPAAPAAQKAVPEAAGEPDKLTTIEGIGPKTAEALNASGITTFAQIASMDAAELERLVKEEHGVRIVGDAATWPKQAQYLVDGDTDGLKAYQDKLVGGREPED
jgi:predicted flap endonuclease-1-like 5' DNA nuclease